MDIRKKLGIAAVTMVATVVIPNATEAALGQVPDAVSVHRAYAHTNIYTMQKTGPSLTKDAKKNEQQAWVSMLADQLCKASGLPKPEIEWSDDKRVAIYLEEKEHPKLHIDPRITEVLDEGELMMSISHELGHYSSDIRDVIKGLTKFTSGAKNQVEAEDMYEFLASSSEERIADKYAILIGGNAGCDVNKLKPALDKLSEWQNPNTDIMEGVLMYPTLMATHHSYGGRVLEIEDNIKQWRENPVKYAHDLGKMRYSIGMVPDGQDLVDFMRDAKKKGRESLGSLVFYSRTSVGAAQKEQVEAAFIGEVERFYQTELSYEKQATADFKKYVDTASTKTLENVFDGLVATHGAFYEYCQDLAQMESLSEPVVQAMQKRIESGEAIFKERVGYVIDTLRTRGIDKEVEIIPISMKEEIGEVIQEREKTGRNLSW